MLHDFESLRLVVLNACHTAEAVGTQGPNPFAGAASSLVMSGVPAVVAMNGPVSDLAAVAFSRTFYQRLAAGDPIEAAVAEGRLAIQRADPRDGVWATPVLFLRTRTGCSSRPAHGLGTPRRSAGGLCRGSGARLAPRLGLAAGAPRRRDDAAHQRWHRASRARQEGRGPKRLPLRLWTSIRMTPRPWEIWPSWKLQLGDDEAALAHAQAAVKRPPEKPFIVTISATCWRERSATKKRSAISCKRSRSTRVMRTLTTSSVTSTSISIVRPTLEGFRSGSEPRPHSGAAPQKPCQGGPRRETSGRGDSPSGNRSAALFSRRFRRKS